MTVTATAFGYHADDGPTTTAVIATIVTIVATAATMAGTTAIVATTARTTTLTRGGQNR